MMSEERSKCHTRCWTSHSLSTKIKPEDSPASSVVTVRIHELKFILIKQNIVLLKKQGI